MTNESKERWWEKYIDDAKDWEGGEGSEMPENKVRLAIEKIAAEAFSRGKAEGKVEGLEEASLEILELPIKQSREISISSYIKAKREYLEVIHKLKDKYSQLIQEAKKEEI